jgi:hypothetical protein
MDGKNNSRPAQTSLLLCLDVSYRQTVEKNLKPGGL